VGIGPDGEEVFHGTTPKALMPNLRGLSQASKKFAHRHLEAALEDTPGDGGTVEVFCEVTVRDTVVEVGRCGLPLIDRGLIWVDSSRFQRLKLKCDGPPSNFAFNFNWCRCTEESPSPAAAPAVAGDDTRPLLISPEPLWSLQFTETTQRVPQKVITSSRTVDDRKPLGGGGGGRGDVGGAGSAGGPPPDAGGGPGRRRVVRRRRQGVTLFHFPAQRKHLFLDTLGGFSV